MVLYVASVSTMMKLVIVVNFFSPSPQFIGIVIIHYLPPFSQKFIEGIYCRHKSWTHKIHFIKNIFKYNIDWVPHVDQNISNFIARD